jgi:hypothetical protein
MRITVTSRALSLTPSMRRRVEGYIENGSPFFCWGRCRGSSALSGWSGFHTHSGWRRQLSALVQGGVREVREREGGPCLLVIALRGHAGARTQWPKDVDLVGKE